MGVLEQQPGEFPAFCLGPVAALRADLLLVDGDPTTTISDTLNTRAVWRRGTRLAA